MSVVIVDIDGTIAEHTEEQRGHFEYEKCGTDTPIQPIIDLVELLAPHHDLIFLSGREDSCREITMEWLQTHVFTPLMSGALYMRTTGDHRRDDIIKREIYEAHIAPRAVAYVLEDRNRNVFMWRSLGLTVLQVADGDF